MQTPAQRGREKCSGIHIAEKTNGCSARAISRLEAVRSIRQIISFALKNTIAVHTAPWKFGKEARRMEFPLHLCLCGIQNVRTVTENLVYKTEIYEIVF
jgi:hypothetical protein